MILDFVRLLFRDSGVGHDNPQVIYSQPLPQGDSGGPLVRKLCDGRWAQVGIASYGEDGCSQPRVFTNVPFYQSWIDGKIAPAPEC